MSEAPLLSVSRRTRSTPFTRRVTEAGVKAYTVYNHMLLPTVFESVEADYHHLKKHVQVWDVSCERQVEVSGPDAAMLIQWVTPRNMAKMQDDQCYYIPMIDEKGGMINDPIAIKISDNRFWVSLADSDMLYWLKGLAIGKGLNVDVFEPDVSPLGVQGPKSDDLMAEIVGDDIRSLGFFRHRNYEINGKSYLIARSGWSKQGGFEIYVDGTDNGEPIWDLLFEKGEKYDVRAGCPNGIERIEGGLLSHGNDMNNLNTPLECGLGKYCHRAGMEICIGGDVLLAEKKNGSKKMIRGITIDGDRVPSCTSPWLLTSKDGKLVGQVTSATWSPDYNANLAIGMVDNDHWDHGTELTVRTQNGSRGATVGPLPFDPIS